MFNWLPDPRFQPVERDADTPTFLTVEVIADDAPLRHDRGSDCGSIEIELASVHHLRVIGVFDAEAVALLARRLGA